MAASFFFYDLETSGFDAKNARVMQFAGQRTDTDLNPIGEPVNVLIRMSPDVLPDPDAVLITGITPQATIQDGISEAEFLKLFHEEVVQPGTTFLGFNSLRFDDKFMWFLNYRNFYDAYEWQWKNDCSKWDILDLVRMTRALRPEGIEWPFAPDGKPTNRLEFLTKVNKLDHSKAHDALNDVYATIAVTKLIKEKQPKLFEYLLNMRAKKKVKELVLQPKPFIYTTGRYPSATLHTSASIFLTAHPREDTVLIYDLRHDPTEFITLTSDELVERWKYTRDEDAPKRLPIKHLKYNHCPAVAPLEVLDTASQERLDLSLDIIHKNLAILQEHQQEFTSRILEALKIMDAQRDEAQQVALVDDELSVDGKLFDGFFSDHDKQLMQQIRQSSPEQLTNLNVENADSRIKTMLPLYKGRNFPNSLSSEERTWWEDYCNRKLVSGGDKSRLAQYGKRLQDLAADASLSDEKKYLLEELHLYAESIVQLDVNS